MTARLLAASLVAAVVIGVAGDVWAPKRAGGARGPREAKVAAAAEKPEPPAEETAPPDPAASADPFDSAARESGAQPNKSGAAGKKTVADPEQSGLSEGRTEKATFGAGCFWHVEEAFEW